MTRRHADADVRPAAGAAARAHRPGGGPRGRPRVRARRSTGHGIVVRLLRRARPPTSASQRRPFDPPLEIVDAEADAGRGLRAGAGHRRRRHDPAGRRDHPRAAAPRCSGVNLGHVGFLAEAEYDDVESTIDAIVAPPLHRRGPADPRRRGAPRRRARRPAPSRSTRPASRRPPASGCSRWSSRSTAGRCRAGAATASSARRRPARPPTTSAPAGRSSGPGSRRC